MWATSCATGPALEGAQIACGMRAAPGAIDKVGLDGEGRLCCHVLGADGTAPLGLCGSGVIDAVCALRRAGGIEPGGLLIGMLPPEVARGRVESRQNLAGVGAAMGLMSRRERERAQAIHGRVRFIDVAGAPAFTERFVEATTFPDPAPFEERWR